MTVLDYGQRYLRLDEQDVQATIKVAPGVTFMLPLTLVMNIHLPELWIRL